MKTSSFDNEMRAVSNVYGRIAEVLIAFPGGESEVSIAQLEKKYLPFFEAFGDRVTFVVLAQLNDEGREMTSKLRKELQDSLEMIMRRAFMLPNQHTIYVDAVLVGDEAERNGLWVQDCFTVVEQNARPVLVEPILCQHSHMRKIAEQVATISNVTIKPTRLLFDGGNILVGNDYAVIGRDELERNKIGYAFGEDTTVEKLEEQISLDFCDMLGVNSIVWIGADQPLELPFAWRSAKTGHQPFFHLDLFVSLGGFYKGCEVVFVAQFELDAEHLAGYWKDWKKELEVIKNELNALENYLHKVHTERRSPRFHIQRIPIGLEVSEHGDLVTFSYNNGLAEYYLGFSRYFCPVYNDWENLNKKAARSLGGHFDRIVPVKWDFDSLALNKGSLNCMTKVLRRKYT